MMQIIISPAKKMVVDRDSLAPRSVPQFLPETKVLLEAMRAMTPQELQRLWNCNDAIARLNVQRLETMELEGDLTPAILSYQGIQYQYITPYRLEMQAKLAVAGAKNLYEFWGNRLAQTLAEKDGWVLNLASKEYSRAIAPHLPQGTELVTCRFGIWKGGKLVERGTQCKMARGDMVRWLAQNQITCREDLPAYSGLGYQFDATHSTPTELIFYTEGEQP